MFETTLKVPHEFSFSECVRFLNRNSKEGLHVAGDTFIEKAISLTDQIFVIKITEGAKDTLCIKTLNLVPDTEQVGLLKEFVTEWLGLNLDLKKFYQFAQHDKILKPLTETFFGLRVIGIPDLFEAISWAIIGQQINLTFAYNLKRRYVENFGRSYLHDNQMYYLHPDPSVVCKLVPEDFLPLQFNRKKAEYLIGVANEIKNSRLSKMELKDLSFQEAHSKLVAIRGIGNWTANYVLMKCFHRPESLPLEDAGLLNALKNQHQLQKKPSFDDARALTSHWGEFSALATFYMWRSL